jgi:hypothetical protein
MLRRRLILIAAHRRLGVRAEMTAQFVTHALIMAIWRIGKHRQPAAPPGTATYKRATAYF